MPDDQLFQYDSSDLQPSAIAQLQKLGTLIQRNPKATFTVEGYTDSFGPPDYNLDLSQRRAEGVKEYLVNVMRINPAQIETHGLRAGEVYRAAEPERDRQPGGDRAATAESASRDRGAHERAVKFRTTN